MASIRGDLNWVTLRIYTINVKKRPDVARKRFQMSMGMSKDWADIHAKTSKIKSTTTKLYKYSHMSIICNPMSVCVFFLGIMRFRLLQKATS